LGRLARKAGARQPAITLFCLGGHRTFSTGDNTGYVNMSLYRVDPGLRDLIRVPIVPQHLELEAVVSTAC
jgi:hypothetical protein